MAMKLPKLQFKQQGSNSVFRPGTWNRASPAFASVGSSMSSKQRQSRLCHQQKDSYVPLGGNDVSDDLLFSGARTLELKERAAWLTLRVQAMQATSIRSLFNTCPNRRGLICLGTGCAAWTLSCILSEIAARESSSKALGHHLLGCSH